MSRRRQSRGPDLTSLIDVLFILVFAALIQTAGREPDEVEAAPLPEPEPVAVAPDAGVPEPAIPTPALAGRVVALVRVSKHGVLTAIELPDRRHAVGVPLVEPSPDPDVVLVYLGERSPDLRVCRIAALQIGAADLSQHVVVITTETPLEELSHALAEGLRRDVGRCLAEQGGLALLVDPATLPGATP